MIEAAGKRGFKAVELPVRLQAHIVSQVRKYDSANVIGMVPGATGVPAATSSIRPITTTLASISLLPVPRSSMARWTTRPVVASSWKWCARMLQRKLLPHAMCILPPLPRRSRACSGQNHLGMHPPEPIRDLTLNLNFDELLPIGLPTSVEVLGSGAHQLLSRGREDSGCLWSPDPAGRSPSSRFLIARTTSVWPASECRPSPSMKAVSSPIIRRGGACSRRRTTTLSDTIVQPTNIAPIWISAPMPDWRNSGSY